MKTSFSVLLSVYYKEHPEVLRESLNSIFSQTLRANEIILVKDGPLTIELDKVITDFKAKYPELKTIPLDKNGGLGNALNIGLTYCSNELVARMDTDDICLPERFEKQIKFMEEHPDIDVLSAWIQEFSITDGKKIYENIKYTPKTHEQLFAYGKKKCPVNHPVSVYRKSQVICSGGYGPFPEDYYLWGKMMVAGCKFHCLQEILLEFRVNPDVFARRGGWSYLKKDIACHNYMRKIGYLSTVEFMRNALIRIIVRLLPVSLRSWVYKKLIRRSDARCKYKND